MHGISQEKDYNSIMKLLMNILKIDIKYRGIKNIPVDEKGIHLNNKNISNKFSELISNHNVVKNSVNSKVEDSLIKNPAIM